MQIHLASEHSLTNFTLRDYSSFETDNCSSYLHYSIVLQMGNMPE